MTEEELSHSKSIEQQLPLLITKLSIIRDNYNNSIEKRKQKIKEREKEIELHEQKHKLTPSIITYNNNNHSHRQYCSLSRNSNHFNSNKDIVSSNNNNIKNIKHIKSTSSLTHYQNFLIKPTSKIGLYMSKTTSKFNLKKSSSAFNLNDATCSIDKSNRNASSSVGFQRQHSFNISHSPKNQISHNNNNNKTKRATVNFSLQTCKKQQQHIVPTSKKYINQNVYHLPIDTLQKLKKLQLQKKEHSLKDYHESLISLGKILLNKDNVKKLNKKFHRIRKDTNVKLGNTKQFLRWIEYKEEKIVNKINKIGQQATFLLNALQVKNPSRFVKKIKFETVMK